MKLEWELAEGTALPLLTGIAEKLQTVADCCAAVEKIPIPCAVHLLLTDDGAIRTVNLAQRGIDPQPWRRAIAVAMDSGRLVPP